MTCTVSSAPYIDLPPKKGSLQLNVSLRDYKPEYMHHVDLMLVDDWDECCREQTDIEVMHLENGLKPEDTYDMRDMVTNQSLADFAATDTIMFNPMGMAIFDMSVAKVYYDLAIESGVGIQLED